MMGLVTAASGVVMLVKGSGSGSPRRAYAPFGMIGIGLMVAYRSFSDFETLDSQDITLMFLFVFALLSLMGLQFLILDRNRAQAGPTGEDNTPTAGEPEKTEP
jgi:hypothetical protein